MQRISEMAQAPKPTAAIKSHKTLSNALFSGLQTKTCEVIVRFIQRHRKGNTGDPF
jgi:hypothetical protein